MTKNFYYLILILVISVSCKSQQTTDDKELYVGGYVYEQHNIPLKHFIYIKKDSIFILDNDLQIETSGLIQETTRDINQKFIKNGNKFSIIQTDTASGQFMDLHYFKATNAPLSINTFTEKYADKTFSAEIPKTLSSPNRDFNIVKNVVFQTDSMDISYEYYYDDKKIYAEKESAPINYFEIDNLLFVSVKNNGIFSRIYQILPKGKDFELLSYGETLKVIEKYQAKPDAETSDYNTYSTCLDSRPGEYYHDDIGYIKGNQYLLKQIQKNAPQSLTGNGYITVHFTINCQGKVGRFGLEQMNRKYQSTQFNPELIEYLVNFIAQIDEWENIDTLNNSMYSDAHAFYMFKIENGKITDICP